MTIDKLAELLEDVEDGTWVQWLRDAVWSAARVGRVVSVVFWCEQNDQPRCKCEGTKRVVSAFRR